MLSYSKTAKQTFKYCQQENKHHLGFAQGHPIYGLIHGLFESPSHYSGTGIGGGSKRSGSSEWRQALRDFGLEGSSGGGGGVNDDADGSYSSSIQQQQQQQQRLEVHCISLSETESPFGLLRGCHKVKCEMGSEMRCEIRCEIRCEMRCGNRQGGLRFR